MAALLRHFTASKSVNAVNVRTCANFRYKGRNRHIAKIKLEERNQQEIKAFQITVSDGEVQPRFDNIRSVPKKASKKSVYKGEEGNPFGEPTLEDIARVPERKLGFFGHPHPTALIDTEKNYDYHIDDGQLPQTGPPAVANLSELGSKILGTEVSVYPDVEAIKAAEKIEIPLSPRQLNNPYVGGLIKQIPRFLNFKQSTNHDHFKSLMETSMQERWNKNELPEQCKPTFIKMEPPSKIITDYLANFDNHELYSNNENVIEREKREEKLMQRQQTDVSDMISNKIQLAGALHSMADVYIRYKEREGTYFKGSDNEENDKKQKSSIFSDDEEDDDDEDEDNEDEDEMNKPVATDGENQPLLDSRKVELEDIERFPLNDPKRDADDFDDFNILPNNSLATTETKLVMKQMLSSSSYPLDEFNTEQPTFYEKEGMEKGIKPELKVANYRRRDVIDKDGKVRRTFPNYDEAFVHSYLQKYEDSEEVQNIHKDLFKEILHNFHDHDDSPPPLLSQYAREVMIDLHLSNPDKWNVAALAQRFRIKKTRVMAILMLMHKQKEIERENPNKLFTDDLIQLMAENYDIPILGAQEEIGHATLVKGVKNEMIFPDLYTSENDTFAYYKNIMSQTVQDFRNQPEIVEQRISHFAEEFSTLMYESKEFRHFEDNDKWHLRAAKRRMHYYEWTAQEVDQAEALANLRSNMFAGKQFFTSDNLAPFAPDYSLDKDGNKVPRKDGQIVFGPDNRGDDWQPGKKRAAKMAQGLNLADYMFIDTSPSATKEDGLMLVKDSNGLVRHATWEERRDLHFRKVPHVFRPADECPYTDKVYVALSTEEEFNLAQQQDPFVPAEPKTQDSFSKSV